MKSTIDNLEATKVKLTVEVPYEELKNDMDKAYKEIANQVNVPGFRRGKVPARIIDQRFGRVAVIEQVINEVLPRFYSQAVAENKLRVMSQPEIEVEEILNTTGAQGGQLKFTAEVDHVPAFELPSVEGVELTVDPLTVTDEDVDNELEELRTRFATLKPIKRKAKKGDFATIDMVATIDGKEVDSMADVSYEIGSKSMLDGMDKALTGMKADEEATFTTTLKGGDHEGEEAEVTLTVKAMKARELPKADDDFAQMVSEFDTIDELREDLKTQAQNRKKADQALQARDRLMDHLLEATTIELPQSVVDEEVKAAVGEKPKKAEKTKAEKEARRRISEQLVLEELAANREIELTQQEVFDFMMQTAQMYGIDPGQMFSDQRQIQAMVAELTRTKALALTLGEVTVKDSDGNEVDMTEFTRDPAKEDAAAEEEGDDFEEFFDASEDAEDEAEAVEKE
ncbi:MAG: trigger factor [Actinomycetaceae bacterium]|nr:trigger factor [Actinomycetaceae bacterium]